MEKRTAYQIIYDGVKIKRYYGNTPATVAKKMAKQIFIEEQSTGTKKITVNFVKNQVQALGGDKYYTYVVQVTKLAKPQSINESANWRHTVKGPDGRVHDAPAPKIYKRYETKVLQSGSKPREKSKK